MEPERWQQIAGLYEAAQGEEKNRRAAFLERACGGDEALRRAVELLLAQDEKSDTFRCPAGQTLWRKQFSKKDRAVMYTTRRKVCGSCATQSPLHPGPTTPRFSEPA